MVAIISAISLALISVARVMLFYHHYYLLAVLHHPFIVHLFLLTVQLLEGLGAPVAPGSALISLPGNGRTPSCLDSHSSPGPPGVPCLVLGLLATSLFCPPRWWSLKSRTPWGFPLNASPNHMSSAQLSLHIRITRDF